MAASLAIPFAKGSFEGCTLHLVNHGLVDFNNKIDYTFDGEKNPISVQSYFFHAKLSRDGK
jgi:hypothetical protein